MNEESLAKLRQRNLDSAGDWKRYAEHRRHCTRLILEAAPLDAPRLCLLGAGNCNDVELTAIAKRFREIHLIDFDKDAVQQGLKRQFSGLQGKILIHAPVDLDAEDVASQLSSLGKFDVVASLCVLSQLIDAIPEEQKNKEEGLPLVRQIRRRHLELLASLAGPEGSIAIANEAVSSDSEPSVKTCEDPMLGPLLVQLALEQKLFMGLNPAVVAGELQALAPTHALSTTPPWKWDFGPRTYAVCGHTLTRQA
ncbi:class I SAM-dependent methyltransferase [Blastopirellula sp. JC732]|uniref:Class I SAM-dependent methyltransferase n=1 Tax=Blastopirellula sediminis TaxID=2894196 RepID=A0A9X1MT38_9BACT|nr:class I SAM-dependent methyltransferase [Blastopirellula sediminis]MCC9604607.1 class I SAM-dependent methyltransferase [Blastopirellula sediminis]MCC9632094.1 class I SAM-dependent methyltransferase [Blastopirellula sediminis]